MPGHPPPRLLRQAATSLPLKQAPIAVPRLEMLWLRRACLRACRQHHSHCARTREPGRRKLAGRLGPDCPVTCRRGHREYGRQGIPAVRWLRFAAPARNSSGFLASDRINDKAANRNIDERGPRCRHHRRRPAGAGPGDHDDQMTAGRSSRRCCSRTRRSPTRAPARLRHDQRAARAGFGLADAATTTTDVRIDDWSLRLDGDTYTRESPRATSRST